ncbi:uncharacterized protein LOC132587077 [Heteronotia binoei]|uniref:uncharacterized protein LOC132587077 n=1 Tax=Heteronotia binoei TaxID=13085 RepID=UPI00292D11B9|nr:uncharacterized protein LOC132587077 [Heteronotia binoei]
MQELQYLLFLTFLALPESVSTCRTRWFDRDNPSGKGDYETLHNLRNEYPDEICPNPLSIEAETLEGTPATHTGQIFKPFNPTEGFACVNQDQENGFCQDYRVRFTCPPDFCSAPACRTRWFDRDDPSGKGDYETLPDLRKEYPDEICPYPLSMEAETLEGTLASHTGQTFKVFNPTEGFACVNQDQENGFCRDYRVRFTCPEDFCSVSTCRTRWFDRDDPSGKGDYETLPDLRKEYPDEICPYPLSIEAETLDGMLASSTGQTFKVFNPTEGFACVNKEQKHGFCRDYRVRFTCPSDFCSVPVCRTRWFDRDNPSGKGDYETLHNLRKDYPDEICPDPVGIEAQTLNGTPASHTGQIFNPFSAAEGFACVNRDQKKGSCQDYKVRFTCPPDFCSELRQLMV